MRVRIGAAVAAPLLWNNWLLPRSGLGRPGRTAANALAATGYALAFGARPNWLVGRGLSVGAGCAALVAVAGAGALAVPPIRRALADSGDRAADVGTVEWVAVHIPIGTVYAEELIFRGTLGPLLEQAYGLRVGAAVDAATFGLWHIGPARAADDSVVGTVLFTAASGVFFGALRRGTGSVTAPALLHWAVNAAAALLPRLASRAVTDARSGPPAQR